MWVKQHPDYSNFLIIGKNKRNHFKKTPADGMILVAGEKGKAGPQADRPCELW
jgi:hypothetical protein